jgi:hypothetical protein
VTVSVAGGDPFHTASFRLTTADGTPGVLISTLEGGYFTIWGTGLGAVVASGRFQITSRIESRGSESRVTVQWTGARLAWSVSSKRRTTHQPWLAATG